MGRTSAFRIGPDERILVGVDPGQQTGVCVVNADTGKIKTLWTTTFWDVYRVFAASKDVLVHRTQFHVEQPSLVKALYARHSEELVKYQSRIETRDKIVWDGGGNAREGLLLAMGLRNLGYRVFDAKPDRRAKWNREDFARYMGWTEASNQHVRDAAYLVLGQRWKRQ